MRAASSPLRPHDYRAKELEESYQVCVGLLAFFWIVPVLFVCFYEALPTGVALTIALLFLVSLVPLHSGRGSAVAAALSSGLIVATLLSLYSYHAHVRPLHLLQDGRVYLGVYPRQPAEAFPDASLLMFTKNASLNESISLGFRSLEGGSHTYCVAPISDSDTNRRHDFWAVGVDCCGKAGDFICGAAGDATARTGLVLPTPEEADPLYHVLGKHLAPASSRRDLFLQAISLAAATHNLTSPGSPVLVEWTNSDRQSLENAAWLRLLGFLVCTFMASTAGAVFLTPAAKGLAAALADVAAAPPPDAEDVRERTVGDEMRMSTASRDFVEVIVWGCLVPLVAFVGCTTLASWSPCWRAGDYLLGLLGLVLAVLVSALAMTRRRLGYALLVILAVVIGLFVGHWNYMDNTFNYCSLARRQTYSDVLASAKSTEYHDAGVVNFVGSTRVGVNESVGFLNKGVTYCAAPILAEAAAGASAASPVPPSPAEGAKAPAKAEGSAAGEAATSGEGGAAEADRAAEADGAAVEAKPLVSFWAVGPDCCDARGAFRCGPAGAGRGKPAGFVLRDAAELRYGVYDDHYHAYLRAVQAAKDVHGLDAPERPILVRWENHMEGLRRNWFDKGMTVVMVSSALAALLLGSAVPVVLLRNGARAGRAKNWRGPALGPAGTAAAKANADAEEEAAAEAGASANPPSSATMSRRWRSYN